MEALDVNVSGTVNTALTFFVAAVLSMCVVVGVAPVALAAFLPLVFIYYRCVLRCGDAEGGGGGAGGVDEVQ